MTFTIREDVQLEVRRCYTCGRYYGHEAAHGDGCPKCVRDMWDRQSTRVLELERSVAALRGALTKAKKR